MAEVRLAPNQLTPFEWRVMTLYASGLRRSEIAARVHVSPRTVTATLTTSKEKLAARSLAEAAAMVGYLLHAGSDNGRSSGVQRGDSPFPDSPGRGAT